MSIIQNSIISPNLSAVESRKKEQASGVNFDSLLNLENPKEEVINELLDSIRSSLNLPAGSGSASPFQPKFPLSAEFTNTFGGAGPLPDFIERITAKLNLSAEKNQALQNIAIANKDITKTPDNMQKLSEQLKAAGIGY